MSAQQDSTDDVGPPIEVVELDQLGCEVDGRQALCDGFYWGSADATFADLGASQDGVQLDLSADFDSTFFLDVIDGATTGTWNIMGDWHMIFSGEVDGIANVTMTGSGEASGTSSRFSVSGTETNIGEVVIVGTSYPISNSGPLPPVEVEVTGGNCAEVTGEWRLSWANLASEVGWTGVDSISGGFTALRQQQFDVDLINELTNGDGSVSAQDVQDARLPELVRDFVDIRRREGVLIFNFLESGRIADDIVISRVLDHVGEYEQIAAAVKNLSACERAISESLLTQFSGWAAKTIDNWAGEFGDPEAMLDGRVVQNFTEAAIRTGAIGAGSSRSKESQERVTEAIRTQLQQVLERTNPEPTDDGLVPSDAQAAVEGLAAARAAYSAGLVIEIHGSTYATDEPEFVETSQRQLSELVPKELELEIDE